MSDRVPLAKVLQREEIGLQDRRGPEVSHVEDLKGITGLKDMQDLSILLGLDDGLDTMGKEMEDIYTWAKKAAGVDGGPEAVLLIKSVIRDAGMSGKGSELLRKVHRWTTLNTKIDVLKMKQAILAN